jgi:hypothetical protein
MSWGSISGQGSTRMETGSTMPRSEMPQPGCIHVARSEGASSRAVVSASGRASGRGGHGKSPADSALYSGSGAIRTSLPEASRPGEPAPVWLSVLLAVACSAKCNGEQHSVRWSCVAGRATYTNPRGEAERIEPLGVSLQGGHTMAVCWKPGETAYTVEVYPQEEKCA